MPRSVRAAGPAVAAAVAGAVLAGAALPGSAAADPVAGARARAAALAARVASLQTRAELTVERYDRLEDELGRATIAQALAQRRADADRSRVEAAQAVIDARARALYESGGQQDLLAAALLGSDPNDAVAGLHIVGALLGGDRDRVGTAAAVAAGARDAAQRAARAAAAVTRLQAAARAAADTVQRLLATRRTALAAADAQVRRLVRERQAAQARASAAAFAAAAARAGAQLSGTSVAPNPVAAAAIAAARTRLGDPYVWGATGPDTFDCSGLTQWAYARAGLSLPRVAADQWRVGARVGLADLAPGDLLFWATDVRDPATIHHVAMYLGDGLMIAAPHTGDVVKIQPVYLDGYIGATRPTVPASAAAAAASG